MGNGRWPHWAVRLTRRGQRRTRGRSGSRPLQEKVNLCPKKRSSSPASPRAVSVKLFRRSAISPRLAASWSGPLIESSALADGERCAECSISHILTVRHGRSESVQAPFVLAARENREVQSAGDGGLKRPIKLVTSLSRVDTSRLHRPRAPGSPS
jgi:hypothetical protein